jgi:hypothetical protein
MPDATLTDLPIVASPGANDKLYIVNNNLSKSVALSSIGINLPSILTTGNANISGDLVISPSSQILFNGVDYSAYVNNEISTNFIPNTGSGIAVLESTSDFEANSAANGLYALSADTVDRLYIKIPDEQDYAGRQVSFIQLGTAHLELSAPSNITIGSLNGSLSSSGQYSKIELTCIDDAAQLYTLTGDLSTS